MAALYEEHGAMVLAVCRRLLRDAVEAEDAAQQTFLSAQRALQNGSRPREPAAWLATIARNECVARTRARTRQPLPTNAEPSETSLDAHAEAVRRENVESLRDAIGSLPAQQREAILLREMRGLSYDEVATSLAVSPAAVESLLFRARKGLQLRLRGAATALSPVGWLASVRDLTAQVAAGGDSVAGPTAAKAVVIGLGTAVIAGGALVGPTALRHGGHHAQRHATAPKAAVAPVASAEAPAPAPRSATAVEELQRAATVAAVVAPPPRISRTPAVVHSEDGRLAHVPGSGEDGPAPTIWPTQTTERQDQGPSSRESEDSRRLSSESGGRSEQQPAETATQPDPTIATPAPQESESSDSGSDHEGESESGD